MWWTFRGPMFFMGVSKPQISGPTKCVSTLTVGNQYVCAHVCACESDSVTKSLVGSRGKGLALLGNPNATKRSLRVASCLGPNCWQQRRPSSSTPPVILADDVTDVAQSGCTCVPSRDRIGRCFVCRAVCGRIAHAISCPLLHSNDEFPSATKQTKIREEYFCLINEKQSTSFSSNDQCQDVARAKCKLAAGGLQAPLPRRPKLQIACGPSMVCLARVVSEAILNSSYPEPNAVLRDKTRPSGFCCVCVRANLLPKSC